MSFLFGGAARPQPSSTEKIALAEAELELIQDMYNRYVEATSTLHTRTDLPCAHRLAQSCTKKCLPKDYREGDLNKGESVCIDRCVGKYMEVNIKIGEKMQSDAQARGAPGGGVGGIGR